ncbi:MAG: flavodoxin family protein [Candidatus Woesearchaeota archaeon]
MKTLIIYFSRTDTTRKVSEALAGKLKADIARITEPTNRNGAIGYIRSGKEASFRQLPKIDPIKADPTKYDLVIIGTPVWAFTMSSPIRSFLTPNTLRKVAFFCTMNGSGARRTFKDMQALAGEPIAKASFLTKDVHKGNYSIDEFIEAIKSENFL